MGNRPATETFGDVWLKEVRVADRSGWGVKTFDMLQMIWEAFGIMREDEKSSSHTPYFGSANSSHNL